MIGPPWSLPWGLSARRAFFVSPDYTQVVTLRKAKLLIIAETGNQKQKEPAVRDCWPVTFPKNSCVQPVSMDFDKPHESLLPDERKSSHAFLDHVRSETSSGNINRYALTRFRQSLQLAQYVERGAQDRLERV